MTAYCILIYSNYMHYFIHVIIQKSYGVGTIITPPHFFGDEKTGD